MIVMMQEPENGIMDYRSRIVVKFHDYVRLPYEDGAERYIQEFHVGPWDKLVKDFPGITVQRLCTAIEPEKILELVNRAIELDPTYRPPNLLTYFAIECPPDVDPVLLAEQLSSWRTVQTAYVESRSVPPSQSINPYDDPRFPNQGYLKKAPEGIDAVYAWNIPGGGGMGIKFVDIEWGWMLNHEDLVGANILHSGVSHCYFDHGTAVLGIVVGMDNQKGGIGIAPHASAQVVSLYKWAFDFKYNKFRLHYSEIDAIVSAINALKFGDVLLLEMAGHVLIDKILPTGEHEVQWIEAPIETDLAIFDYIRLGTALGIVIVEPAGNGGLDMDSWKDPLLNNAQWLNRECADFKDSGAIMVGAATSTIPHHHVGAGWNSCRGSRVDCYAWGENIDTCWTDSSHTKSLYTVPPKFDGTSGASAIIAGAALVVQGIAEAKLKRRFSPRQLRAILSDKNLGTPAEDPKSTLMDQDLGIGVMPDLKAIITKQLNVAPDVYIRDFVGDRGDPHVAANNLSPDIILLHSKVTDPQKSFGEGSGTENSNTLGKNPKPGQDNYIYVRVRNRGGSAAKNVGIKLYWSPISTLATPRLWTPVSSPPWLSLGFPPNIPDVVIPNVPNGDLLTVSDAITWKAKDIPFQGCYCLVAMIGNDLDPAPELSDLINWGNFLRLIRENNNVTRKGFCVMANLPKTISKYVELPFLAPGAPETALRFRLEATARLPEGASAWLEMPLYLVDALGERSPYLRLNKERDVAWVPLNPHGRTAFQEALFPANSAIELMMLVDIPEEFRQNEYEVFVSQFYENQEVGRVTWRLVPPDRVK